tara:strand:+ start:50 stop:865 length:816 start_codon:yes stop_codon:yes gene_type:complete
MKLKYGIITMIMILVLLSCATNPFTGKQTMALVPNSQLFPTAFQQYDQFLSENKIIEGTADAAMVKRVGQKIAVASERWLNANGYVGYLKDYKWEYHLVEDKAVNAWAMPGGKIVVYTGILPIAKGETGLAAILGHEVAHALANHGQQRMSAGMLQQIGAVGLNVALQDNKNQALFNDAYGIGSQVGVILPFSRSHESEADSIGLTIMAIAGYNPEEAVALWKRMSAQSNGQAPPQLLSTHPSNDSRIANLEALVPKAKEEARKFGVTSFK